MDSFSLLVCSISESLVKRMIIFYAPQHTANFQSLALFVLLKNLIFLFSQEYFFSDIREEDLHNLPILTFMLKTSRFFQDYYIMLKILLNFSSFTLRN